jgi:hypothetical protein
MSANSGGDYLRKTAAVAMVWRRARGMDAVVQALGLTGAARAV